MKKVLMNVNENIESLRVEMRVNLAEIKNSMSQMQAKLEALMARVNEAEESISELEDGLVKEKTKIEAGLRKIHAHKCRLWEITDSMKCSNVRFIGIPKGVEKERGLEEIFEQIIAENFPNLQRKQAFLSKRQKGPLPRSMRTDQHHVT